jgi:hypothetical protein
MIAFALNIRNLLAGLMARRFFLPGVSGEEI